LLSRLCDRRGLRRGNLLALRAEISSNERNRGADDESWNNHPALPFKFIDR